MSLMLVATALPIGGCGGNSADNGAASTPAPTSTPAGPAATPRSSAGQLPPAFVSCMADQGFDVTSSADIHSAPPDVLQMCFGTLHGGGG